MTTTTVSAFEVIKNRLPNSVIYQFAPVDTPMAMENFLVYWNPIAVILMESEIWPNLILSASRKGIEVALSNARMSCKSFKRWSLKISRPLISLLLSKFSLIVALVNDSVLVATQNTAQAVRYQLLNAPPFIINFAGDLKYAVGGLQLSESENKSIEGLKLQLNDRPVWMAASIHKSEAEVMISVHKELAMAFPNLITIIVMRHPQHGKQLAQVLQKRGMLVAMRSKRELGMLYRVTPIAVIGGSFQSGLSGHNFSEAAAAGCAVLTGPHLGHFSRMLTEMKQVDSLSVLQVKGKEELVDALKQLLSRAELLEAHQKSAKLAFSTVSNGVVKNVWKLVNNHCLGGRQAIGLNLKP